MKKVTLLAISLVFLFAACSDDDDNNSANNEATGFSGGSFTVMVNSVTDGCFDGAMTSIILPEGTPNPLPAPVNVPAQSALPTNVDIQFNAPFQNVTGIPFEASGENGLRTAGEGFPQTNVDISGDADDCVADMMVTAELTATDDDNFTGTATLSITSATGEDCPAFSAAPPCNVTTPLSATRAN